MYVYFPAIKGHQGDFVYYSVQVPFNSLNASFVFDDSSLPIELRCQREIDISRAKRFSDYINSNPNNFVTGAVVGTVDDQAHFIPLEGPFSNGDVGVLRIPATHRIVLCDGQHRQKGIQLALEADNAAANATLPIILYAAEDTARKQQIFTDINANTVKPSTSLSMTFDHRSSFNSFIKEVAKVNPAVCSAIEYERNSVGSKSLRLWPLVSFKSFIVNLTGLTEKSFDEQICDEDNRKILVNVVSQFIKGLDNLPMWADVLSKRIPIGEVRQDYIVAHAVFLEALGVYGAHLLQHFNQTGKPDWSLMEKLREVSVDKASYIGRCVTPQMTIAKNQFGIKSTASKICRVAGIPTSQHLDAIESSVQ
jgi:DNA sulfur modification protein DndB